MLNQSTSLGRYRLVALLATCVCWSTAIADDVVEFEIPAQSAAKGLNLYAEQAELQIMFPYAAVKDVETNEVVGEFDKDIALETLLADTGLEAVYGKNNTATVRPISGTEPEDLEPGKSQPASSPVLMAQNQTSAVQNQTSQSRTSYADEEEPPVFEEILVTGSMIRGAESASPLVTIDRDDIDRSGFSTTEQVIQSLPQNFSGGPNLDTQTTGIEGGANIANGSGVNLRGLGAGSTLVLVNGRRQAASGLIAGFVDVSSVPITAIERIEVLTDGASAIYGSDAVGGVVNIILKEKFEGLEAQIRYAPDTGNDYDESQVGLMGGTAWSSGSAMISYEYSERGGLAYSDRPYLVSADLRPFGGDDFRDIRSQPGNIFSLGTGATLAIPTGQDGTSLTAADLIVGVPNLRTSFAGADVLPNQEQHSVFATLNQEVRDGFGVFAEVRYRVKDTDQLALPTTTRLVVPTQNAFIDAAFATAVNGAPIPVVVVDYSFVEDLGHLALDTESTTLETMLGATIEVGQEWAIEVFGSASSEQGELSSANSTSSAALGAALADSDPTTAFNPFGDGSNTNPVTLEQIRRTVVRNTDADVTTFNIRADGPLMSLPGGDLKLAIGADYREEEFTRQTVSTDLGLEGLGEFDRDVTAVFAEFFLPLVSSDNAKSFARRLEVSVAARYDDYSDFGSTVNPKIGVLWAPTESVTLRSTFGTSFKTPRLTDLDPDATAAIRVLNDPDAPTGRTNTLIRTGTNPDLTEETSESWSLGIEVQPVSFEQLRFSLNYFDIEYDDRIGSPDTFRNLHQPRFAGAVTFDFTQADLDAICLGPDFIDDPAVCTVALVEAIGDARLRNTVLTEITGFDASVSYDLETAAGDWNFGVDGTYFTAYKEAFSVAAPVFDLEDTIGNPVSLRARARASWSHNGFGANAFINFTDSYVDNVSIPERKIDSYTTVDLQLSYSTGASRDVDKGWLVSLSVQNLFDEDPPFANSQFGGYDRANADPLRRLIALQARKQW